MLAVKWRVSHATIFHRVTVLHTNTITPVTIGLTDTPRPIRPQFETALLKVLLIKNVLFTMS